jgi:putative NADPH-quinone reductase
VAQVKHITLIQGHPDPTGGHFCHKLADAYLQGAATSGHAVEVINVAQLEFPLLRSQAEFHGGPVPSDIARAQTALANAEHLVFIYPIWMGTMPALLKGFLLRALVPCART